MFEFFGQHLLKKHPDNRGFLESFHFLHTQLPGLVDNKYDRAEFLRLAFFIFL